MKNRSFIKIKLSYMWRHQDTHIENAHLSHTQDMDLQTLHFLLIWNIEIYSGSFRQ